MGTGAQSTAHVALAVMAAHALAQQANVPVLAANAKTAVLTTND